MLTVVVTHDKSNISFSIMQKSNPNEKGNLNNSTDAYAKSQSNQETNNYIIQAYNHGKKQHHVQMGWERE